MRTETWKRRRCFCASRSHLCRLRLFAIANVFSAGSESSFNYPASHVFPNALICGSSFITITGALSALIVPCEHSYPQMNASCKGTQNTCLCNVHRAQLEPILFATSGYGGLFFSVYGMWLCACKHLFPMTNTTHFPICLYQSAGRKQPWNEPKRLFIPLPRNIWLQWMSPLVFNLLWCAILGWFQLQPGTHYYSPPVEMRDFVKASAQTVVLANWSQSLRNPPTSLNLSGEVKQSQAWGKDICIGISGVERSPWQPPPWPRQPRSHTVYRITHKFFMRLIITTRLSAEIVKKEPAQPFISTRCLWCLGYISAPAAPTPRSDRGHSSHTSSISGDHRAVFGTPGTGGGGRWRWRSPSTTAPLWRGGGGPSLPPVNHCPSTSRKPARADLWERHPLPPLPLSVFVSPSSADRRGPPSPSSVSSSLCPVTLWSLVARQPQRGMHKTHKTHTKWTEHIEVNKTERKYDATHTQLGLGCFSANCTKSSSQFSNFWRKLSSFCTA